MTEHYWLIKHIHQGTAALSLALFVVRGGWMLTNAAMLKQRWVRILPHVIDTVLLTSALLLAWIVAQYPFVHGWVTAKVIALIAYIFLGTVALKRGRTRETRLAAFIAALAVFGYIVAVALTKQPLPGVA